MIKPRSQKLVGAFACPKCRKKGFVSLQGVNCHITLKHPDYPYRVRLTRQNQAYRVITAKAQTLLKVKIKN